MPVAKIKVLETTTLPATHDDAGKVILPSRTYNAEAEVTVDVSNDALPLIEAGSAIVIEVPHQDGYPRGTADSNLLLALLRRSQPT